MTTYGGVGSSERGQQGREESVMPAGGREGWEALHSDPLRCYSNADPYRRNCFSYPMGRPQMRNDFGIKTVVAGGPAGSIPRPSLRRLARDRGRASSWRTPAVVTL